MKKRVLIVGSKGMAGHIIYHYLKSVGQYEIADIARDDSFFSTTYKVDVSDTSALKQAIDDFDPDIIVNCIGILNADAENNPDKAILLNSYLPHYLAKLATAVSARLIHISTDCVFNGKKGGYNEDDIKDGFGFYAQSKALGEVTYAPHLTIRTSIIGPELKDNGIGLMHWFLNQQGEIKGYTKAFWTGVTTLELAKAVHLMVQHEIKGLYHLVNNIPISKYDLVGLFKQTFTNKVDTITPYDGYAVNKSLVNTRADYVYPVPSYKQMLDEAANWIKMHGDYYPHY